MREITLDKIDREIIRWMSKDGRIRYTILAKTLNLTSQTISDRIDKLKKKGVIKRFRVDLNPETIGASIEFITEVDVDVNAMETILPELERIEEIHVIRITTGIHDIFCMGYATSIENLHDVVEKRISSIPGVKKTYTSIILRNVKNSQILNLDRD
ncbi:MAG: Lrp/AsnC family transcriptional regulator [Candidatus Heimdallarchaeota archaeon]